MKFAVGLSSLLLSLHSASATVQVVDDLDLILSNTPPVAVVPVIVDPNIHQLRKREDIALEDELSNAVPAASLKLTAEWADEPSTTVNLTDRSIRIRRRSSHLLKRQTPTAIAGQGASCGTINGIRYFCGSGLCCSSSWVCDSGSACGLGCRNELSNGNCGAIASQGAACGTVNGVRNFCDSGLCCSSNWQCGTGSSACGTGCKDDLSNGNCLSPPTTTATTITKTTPTITTIRTTPTAIATEGASCGTINGIRYLCGSGLCCSSNWVCGSATASAACGLGCRNELSNGNCGAIASQGAACGTVNGVRNFCDSGLCCSSTWQCGTGSACGTGCKNDLSNGNCLAPTTTTATTRPAVTPTFKACPSPVYRTVAKDDTCYNIAAEYEIDPWTKIQDWNPVSCGANAILGIGDVLQICLSEAQLTMDLTRHRDIQWLIPVTVGSNRVKLMMDTGSGGLWVANRNCPSNCGGDNRYTPGSTAVRQNKAFSAIFGGISASGEWYRDNVAIGSIKTSLLFGSVDNEVGNWANWLWDGFIGFSFPYNDRDVWIVRARDSGVLKYGLFGLHLTRTNGASEPEGQLDLGGVDQTKFTGSINYVPLIDNHGKDWKIHINSFRHGNTVYTTTQTTALLDTGAFPIIGPKAWINSIASALGATRKTQFYSMPCSNKSRAQNLYFTLESGITLTIPPSTYIYQDSPSDTTCTLAMEPSDYSSFLLGTAFIQQYYTVWYYGSGSSFNGARVGFATLA